MGTELRPSSEPSGLRPSAPAAAFADEPLADPRLQLLRGITRQMATADDLETVLRSITGALARHSDALIARIFLLVTDSECAYCRRRIEAGLQKESTERALHLFAEDANTTLSSGVFHIAPLDSMLPAAAMVRERRSFLVPDWRTVSQFVNDTRIAPLWNALGVIGVAGYPLEVHGEIIGSIGYLARRSITPEEFEVLGIFADQAAIAIKSAQLFAETERYKNRLQVENEYLQHEIRAESGFDNIVGESDTLRSVLRKVRQVAGVETTVLLTGETGTGKELIARALHDSSARKDRPLIKINCGAIPQGIVESELFGHEKGAFTGALQRRIGRFELADKGTLFMDEVGELPLDTQVKLLRVLQEQEFERVGSTRAMKVDVRLIAATNRDLEKEVAEGRFRADLFYRLNVFPILLPPLRERPADIPVLVEHFLAVFQRKMAKSLKSVDARSMEQLQRYAWPGNIRELQNVLERACVLATGPVVSIGESLRSAPGATPAAGAATIAAPVQKLEDSERAHIRRALAAAGGRVHGPSGAAELLGINPSTLRSRMQKLGISTKGPAS
jgi:transcriptional regulator with GAF, ATPase, and Fis domain